MLSDKEDVTSFTNEQLRDRWEKRAQNLTDQSRLETDRRGRSALNGLFSEWDRRLSLRNGVSSKAEKKKGDMSDFRKYVARDEEAAPTEPEIRRFKIKPPPKIPKPEPPPPPPPPRRKAPPRARRPKRKVEVDLLKLCWGESWKSLKLPKHLLPKPDESRTGLSEIEFTDNRMYRPMGFDLEAEWGSAAAGWRQAWKQVKSPALLELSKENKVQWEILSEAKLIWRHKAEIDEFALPVWAGTWKTMIFVLRQQKPDWDRVWPDHQQNPSDKMYQLRHLEEQSKPSGWEDSWKSSSAELKPRDSTDDRTAAVKTCSADTEVKISAVFLPGWSESWLLAAAPLEDQEELHRNWCSSCGYWQEIRWVVQGFTGVPTSPHRHVDEEARRHKPPPHIRAG
ncbi:uncharacterized protein LOC144542384 [Centroberyx gerrardi]